MQTYLYATDVILVVPLVDPTGVELSVTAVSYRVTDSTGVEITPLTLQMDFVPLSTEAVITIPAASNALATGNARDLRAVELHCMVDGNSVLLHADYIIQSNDALVVGINSFQTMVQAEFNADLIPNLEAWTAASNTERIAALVEARLHILMLNFRGLNGRNLWGQDNMNFVPEGSFSTNYISAGYIYGGDLTWLTPDQLAKLPPDMLHCINRAQIVEADFILGGDPLGQKRESGIISESVGESRIRLEPQQPLRLPVCRRAAQYLGRYITFAKLAGNA